MNPDTPYDVIVIGAGIAGVAAAHYLAVAGNALGILLLDRQQPLSLTTSKSGENFRDYWPQECMRALSSRSIELMLSEAEDAGEAFGMKFSGYEFASQSADRDIFGAGPAGGFTRETEPGILRDQYPYLDDSIRQVARIERGGAFDVHALGSLLLRKARAGDVQLAQAEVTSVRMDDGGIYLLQACGADGPAEFSCRQLVLAAGPFTGQLATQLGVELPLENFLQRKFVVPDPLGLVPTDMPFTIFADPHHLPWNDEERSLIESDPEFAWLLAKFPAGLHIKPEPGGRIKLGWAYNRQASKPSWDPPADNEFPSIVMRGASKFLPALRHYVDEMPTPVVTFSGYYTRTPDNWPLIGPLGPPGLFTVAGLSGYGTMVACAAGELCAAWMTGDDLPDYARNFDPSRYNDKEMVTEMNAIESDGQL